MFPASCAPIFLCSFPTRRSSDLADLGQGVDVVQRIAAFRQVDHQDVRACRDRERLDGVAQAALVALLGLPAHLDEDRKSTRLNSSHVKISYAVFCLKKKKHTATI